MDYKKASERLRYALQTGAQELKRRAEEAMQRLSQAAEKWEAHQEKKQRRQDEREGRTRSAPRISYSGRSQGYYGEDFEEDDYLEEDDYEEDYDLDIEELELEEELAAAESEVMFLEQDIREYEEALEEAEAEAIAEDETEAEADEVEAWADYQEAIEHQVSLSEWEEDEEPLEEEGPDITEGAAERAAEIAGQESGFYSDFFGEDAEQYAAAGDARISDIWADFWDSVESEGEEARARWEEEEEEEHDILPSERLLDLTDALIAARDRAEAGLYEDAEQFKHDFGWGWLQELDELGGIEGAAELMDTYQDIVEYLEDGGEGVIGLEDEDLAPVYKEGDYTPTGKLRGHFSSVANAQAEVSDIGVPQYFEIEEYADGSADLYEIEI